MIIHLIAAARPNFMKIAPLYHALKREDWADPVIVHTGQHYDLNMSDAFFKDLELPEPHIHLGIGSGSHAEQTGKVMIAYEKVLMEHRPDLVVVVGDVNSTMACTIAAVKVSYGLSHDSRFTIHNSRAHRPLVAHLEAGLRSFDRTMPEEINRLVTDSLANILWTPSPGGDENLLREGISKEKVVCVGNIMIDSLEMLRHKIEEKEIYKEFNVDKGGYGLITLHRPSNVDNPEILSGLCNTLTRVADKIPLIFPAHPRTRKNLKNFGLKNGLEKAEGIFLIEPMNYIHFMNLVFNCRLAITDSGGIQEETTYLGIPCLTLRPNTERPITVDQGTNQLCSPNNLEGLVWKILAGEMSQSRVPELWDGHTAERVVKSIKSYMS
jgi:UDP-N-acetylglucosamine 2-epimerase (non-hydrolysing)